ncbi:MFS transporter [Saccharothrix deserti]|uniref:MFS transporter n=1 Tax=Saccharothrix deserti TaxID=2593674 RepID=UPI00131CDB82|nr:MFS transporter [Saccharothrix deserti]
MSLPSLTASPAGVRDHREARKVALASFVGTAIEWYDFFLYGAAATLVFGPLFFPSSDPVVSQLAALSAFAVGFIARPIGGIVAGHYGDKIGRKRMLVLSLLLMGGATVAVGLLPTYAQIGVWAPVLLVLLRLAQGFGVGAEWGGAALMAVEHAPPHRRGLYGSAAQIGVPVGAIVANLVMLVSSSTSKEAFLQWGWRVGFIASFVLVAFGLIVRKAVTESPLFEQAKQKEPTRSPLVQVLRQRPMALLRSVFLTAACTTFGYLVLVYVLSYGSKQVGYSRESLLMIIIVASVVQIVATLALSSLTDKLGRRRVVVGGAIGQIVVAMVFFLLFDTGVVALALLACALGMIVVSAQYGPLPALLAEQFPTKMRYSGVSLGYQLGSVVGGGIGPIAATAIFAATGNSLWVGAYVAGLAVLTIIAALATGETRSAKLEEV